MPPKKGQKPSFLNVWVSAPTYIEKFVQKQLGGKVNFKRNLLPFSLFDLGNEQPRRRKEHLNWSNGVIKVEFRREEMDYVVLNNIHDGLKLLFWATFYNSVDTMVTICGFSIEESVIRFYEKYDISEDDYKHESARKLYMRWRSRFSPKSSTKNAS